MNSPKFCELWECVSDVVLAVEASGRVVYANRRAAETLGYASERLKGELLDELLSPTATEGEWFSAEFLHADGTRVPVRVRRSQLQAGVLFPESVTVYALTLAAGVDAEEAQEQRFQAMGYLASRMVHDVNNVLTPILGYTELLLEIPNLLEDPGKSRQYVQTINNAAQQLAASLRRIREFYRQPASTEQLTSIPFGGLVRSVVAQVRRERGKAGMDAVDWQVQVDSTALVKGYEEQLRQAVAELIANAVEAVEPGGAVTVQVSEAEERVILSVQDTGPGMSFEVQQRCLDPMFTTKGAAHAGLGLSIVRGVARRHQGALLIDSTPGQGVQVRLVLPGIQPALQPQQVMEPEAKPSLRVLVVDDSPDVRSVVAALLRFEQHQPEAVASASEALEWLQQHSCDVVITDQTMPGCSGLELAQEINARYPDCPVILLTGASEELDPQEAEAQIVASILTKPLALSDLRAALSEVAGATGRPDLATR